MRKIFSNIITVLILIGSALIQWGGLFMDLIELPEIREKISKLSSQFVPGDTPYLLMAFSTFLLIIINWPSIASFVNPKKKRSEEKIGKLGQKEEESSPNFSTDQDELLEFVVYSHLLKISAKQLRDTRGGSTRYALYYSWNDDAGDIFDNIEGFGIKMFEHDMDTDGIPELIIEYHCGAHTMVMNIYKIPAYGSSPTLIPGASIGSDWPDIRWHDGNKDEGTVIVAKHRNWSKNPTADFVEDKYLLKNGVCQKLA